MSISKNIEPKNFLTHERFLWSAFDLLHLLPSGKQYSEVGQALAKVGYWPFLREYERMGAVALCSIPGASNANPDQAMRIFSVYLATYWSHLTVYSSRTVTNLGQTVITYNILGLLQNTLPSLPQSIEFMLWAADTIPKENMSYCNYAQTRAVSDSIQMAIKQNGIILSNRSLFPINVGTNRRMWICVWSMTSSNKLPQYKEETLLRDWRERGVSVRFQRYTSFLATGYALQFCSMMATFDPSKREKFNKIVADNAVFYLGEEKKMQEHHSFITKYYKCRFSSILGGYFPMSHISKFPSKITIEKTSGNYVCGRVTTL